MGKKKKNLKSIGCVECCVTVMLSVWLKDTAVGVTSFWGHGGKNMRVTHLSAHESQGTSSALIIQVPLPWFLSMFWGLHWSPLTWKSSTYLIYLPCSYGVSLKQRSRLYVSDDNPVLVVLSTQKVEAQQPLESQEFWISSIVKTLFKNKKILKENKEDKHVGAHL